MSMAFAGLINHPISRFLRNLDNLHDVKDRFLLDHRPNVLLRASHSGSAGSTTEHRITCGSWSHSRTREQDFLHQWFNDTPAQHFDNHFDKGSKSPTMFISTTPEFLRALHIAVRWYWEQKQEIKITIIDVAAALRTNHYLTNAGVIARRLKRDDSVMKGTELLFLGRVTEDAILHQINFDARLYLSLCTYFPSFETCTNLESLRNCVGQDFRRYDQWMFDGSDPAADDGLRCAFVANNFGLDLRSQKDVYAWLAKQMWNWKGPFTTITDHVRRFEEVINWAIDREEP